MARRRRSSASCRNALRHPQKSDVWMLSPLDVPTSPFGADGEDGSRGVHYFSAVGRVAAQPRS